MTKAKILSFGPAVQFAARTDPARLLNKRRLVFVLNTLTRKSDTGFDWSNRRANEIRRKYI